MSIYPHKVCIPYTYFIMWTNIPAEEGNKYYGSQYGKMANPNDILEWNYHTSSKYVHSHVKKYGKPDIVVIHRTFNSVDECREFEHWYLKRVDVINKKDWINKTTNKAFDPIMAAYKPPGFGERMSLQRKGNPIFVERAHAAFRLASDAIRGTKRPPETIARMSKPKSEEHRKNIAKATAGRKWETKECEHCHKIMTIGNYNRWHGDNCKCLKKTFISI